jgi:hypothetical protein
MPKRSRSPKEGAVRQTEFIQKAGDPTRLTVGQLMQELCLHVVPIRSV